MARRRSRRTSGRRSRKGAPASKPLVVVVRCYLGPEIDGTTVHVVFSHPITIGSGDENEINLVNRSTGASPVGYDLHENNILRASFEDPPVPGEIFGWGTAPQNYCRGVWPPHNHLIARTTFPMV